MDIWSIISVIFNRRMFQDKWLSTDVEDRMQGLNWMWCLLFYSCTSFYTDFLFWWGIKISYLTRYESAVGIPDSAHNWKSLLRFLSWREVICMAGEQTNLKNFEQFLKLQNPSKTHCNTGSKDRVMMTLTCYVHYKVICNGLAHRVKNLRNHRCLHHVDLN